MDETAQNSSNRQKSIGLNELGGEKPDEFSPKKIAALSGEGGGFSQVIGLPNASAIVDILTPQTRAIVVDAFLNAEKQVVTKMELCDRYPVTESCFEEHIEVLVNKYEMVYSLGERGNKKLYQLNTNNPLVQLCLMGNDLYQTGMTDRLVDSKFLSDETLAD